VLNGPQACQTRAGRRRGARGPGQSNASGSGQHPAERGGVERGRHAQRTREGLPPLGQLQAGQVRVQMGAPPGQPASRVRHQDAVAGDDAQQLGRVGALPAPDAGADRRAQTELSASPTGAGAAGGSRVTSGRMSMRQPVSRAASRAFWPSLPIASESW
jgi:hypothetical protein